MKEPHQFFTGGNTAKLTAFALAFLLATSCASPPKNETPALPMQSEAAFSRSGTEALPQLWWTVFEDSALSQRIATALENNFTLASAWQRLEAARAIARREGAALLPGIDAGASQEFSLDESGDGSGRLSLTLGAQYEVDLWNRIDSRAAAEAFRARAAEADYRSAALTISAEIAMLWFQRIEAINQRSLIKRQVETNQQVLDLLRARLGIGLVSSEDILRQQLLIKATQAELITVETEIAIIENQLAVLEGRAPQERVAYANPEPQLPELAPRPATGLPAELLQRRPDIMQAYFQIQAADSDLSAAISEQFPRLTVSAGLDSITESASDLFSDWLGSIAASFFGPLYDGGERQAEVDRTRAIVQQRLFEYGQAVLIAFQEVEDALEREDRQRERISNLQERLALAERTYRQLQSKYFNGATEYISVLTALNEEQSLRRDLLRAQRLLIEYRVALYRALAGGFETPREQMGPATSAGAANQQSLESGDRE